jgi:transglutaminase-like putative cysteine protease
MIATELYAGSKRAALGTLREGRGNHVDQASPLDALYRAAGIPARRAGHGGDGRRRKQRVADA